MIFSANLLYHLQGKIYNACQFLLPAVQDVGVGGGSDNDGSMTELFGDELQGSAGFEEIRGVGMAERMEAAMAKIRLHPFIEVPYLIRSHHGAVIIGNDVPGEVVQILQHGSAFILALLDSDQKLPALIAIHDGADRGLRLWKVLDFIIPILQDHRPADEHFVLGEGNVTPAETADFPGPHPGVVGKHDGGEQLVLSEMFLDFFHILRRKGGSLLRRFLVIRKLQVLRRVIGKQPAIVAGINEGPLQHGTDNVHGILRVPLILQLIQEKRQHPGRQILQLPFSYDRDDMPFHRIVIIPPCVRLRILQGLLLPLGKEVRHRHRSGDDMIPVRLHLGSHLELLRLRQAFRAGLLQLTESVLRMDKYGVVILVPSFSDIQ